MKSIMITLEQIAKGRNIIIKNVKLKNEDIIKYKNIAFNKMETELEDLDERQISEFYNFAKESIVSYNINPYIKNTMILKILRKIML